ncbi:sigma-70 family RNA polymerase sigma factor [Nocardioides sp. HDW12B]|nr:sigma-70 family RNA polymerase sigma factor [Nocardioides sp. HDW12B]
MRRQEAEARFAALYADTFDRLLAYALRRVDEPERAADVVAETFLVAWRRLAEVPPGDDARLWLYGVARRVLANDRRGRARRQRLGQRLRDELPRAVPDHADRLAATATVRAALDRLREADREVLTLTVWEELEPREVAIALDLPVGTVRARLSRARARLRDELGDAWGADAPGVGRHDPGPPGHEPGDSDTHQPRPRGGGDR